ncbi:DNA alkylation repair protein [Nocardioides sp. SYSU D00038]|uniref:DNA alkylation repair protein n=1 Tax=Nocardioides sp. SYSU D00038 TaxID=2812554 RepID=UPI001967DC21|nr:DNA alkylation repair protein [Nocardioides sp. SYSU D00038]
MPEPAHHTTAAAVVEALAAAADPAELATLRRRLSPDEPASGIRMGDLFDIARAATGLPLAEVDRLLDHPAYEPRMAAACILDLQVRRAIGDQDRYDLYLHRHDRLTTWDMVDRAAPRVVGGHLIGKSLDPLHELSVSPDPLRRRTAITAPLFFVSEGSNVDLVAAYDVAATLAGDQDPLVSRPVAVFLRHASTRDPDGVRTFLDRHGARMPEPTRRLASERLPT